MPHCFADTCEYKLDNNCTSPAEQNDCTALSEEYTAKPQGPCFSKEECEFDKGGMCHCVEYADCDGKTDDSLLDDWWPSEERFDEYEDEDEELSRFDDADDYEDDDLLPAGFGEDD